jgi:hypothetical protein
MAVFRVTFERWVAEGEERTMDVLARDTLRELRSVAADVR